MRALQCFQFLKLNLELSPWPEGWVEILMMTQYRLKEFQESMFVRSLIRKTKVGLAAAKEPKLAVISYFRTSESIHIEFYNRFFYDNIPYWHHYNPLLNTNHSKIVLLTL